MITETQLPEKYRDIIDNQVKKFDEKFSREIFSQKIRKMERIPSAENIPTEDSIRWIQIPDVICVFVDMKNSTKLSAYKHARTTAKIYTLFTGTAVRIFRAFNASYIDIKGDGIFALFNYDQVHTSLASAVTFKTFVQDTFLKKVHEIDTGVHIGIHQATLLVSKIGLKRNKNRDDMHNEVWAGKTVNMAVKLASLSENNEIVVSNCFYEKITSREALYCCRCSSTQLLWEEQDVSSDDRFSFDKINILKSLWCKKHGAEYLQNIIDADNL
ncbi:Guanylate cyclase domain-containing protein [Candidatus Electronema halotolerans]